MMHDPLPAVEIERPTVDRFDVIVVGCGAAGLYSALCLPAELSVAVVTKATVSRSASDWAQGGLAAVTAPDDSVALHVADTLAAGAGLCDRVAVEFLVAEAPACVAQLVELGVAFDRDQGQLAVTLEAAHSRRRVLHAADATGRAVVSALVARVLERSNITVLSETLAIDLWLTPDRQSCQGIACLQEGQLRWLAAGATILATGGGGQVFAHTTNPSVSTGDGVAMAYRAGAVLRDLEFVQFHPTALDIPGAPHFLISEAVRGEGAHLVDDQGRRFAFDFHEAGELAPRDAVSRAVYSHLQRHGGDRVWLDLQPIPEAQILHRFPNILKACRDWGIDPLREPIPVSPAAHYWMGGIATDRANCTSLGGLYAVGETASTGVHGANRLASNSLLECIVFGAQFRNLTVAQGSVLPIERCLSLPTIAFEPSPDLAHWRNYLPKLVWSAAGICRKSSTLIDAIAQLQAAQSTLRNLPIQQLLTQLQPGETCQILDDRAISAVHQWVETRNLLDVATSLLESALFRTESRGGHYRVDHPNTDPAWACHTLLQGNKRWISQSGLGDRTSLPWV
ncbi:MULTISPECIES: L-aspartate oxidase [unclassified Limnothrix]|uniref:L-aspartate oxidase n=1 Tax=unclassified Limnothrix TaxID=2632864 RepID=UPI001F552877|nr:MULTISPECIES: L-aspartate oxidase [unclassified Limnothrix]